MTIKPLSTKPDVAPAFGRVDLAVLGLVLIWGANFVVVKASVGQIQPLAFTAIRFTLAALVMLVLGRLTKMSLRVARDDWGRIFWLALIGNILYQPLFVVGLSLTTAGNSSIILAAAPTMVAVLTHWRGVEHLRPRAWVGVALAFGGLGLVIWGSGKELTLGSDTLRGDLMTLVAAFLWAAYTVMAAAVVKRVQPLVVTTLSLIMASVGLSLFAIPAFMAQDWRAVTLSGWGGVLYSGSLAIGLGYFIWGKGVQRLGGPRTAIYSNLVPVAAVIIGAIFLGERIGVLQIIGAACVLGGIVLTRLKD